MSADVTISKRDLALVVIWAAYGALLATFSHTESKPPSELGKLTDCLQRIDLQMSREPREIWDLFADVEFMP